MLRIVAVYGVIAGLIVAVGMQITMRLVPDGGAIGVVAGYLTMLVAMSLVFAGVKQYRDTVLGGVIRFGPALGAGFGIALIASFFYVAAWELYLFMTGYTFMDEYAASTIEAMRAAGKPTVDIARATADMETLKIQYANPLIRPLFTLMEIAPVALLVPLITAAILRNPRMFPAKT
jgi:hypothetical protein